MNRFLFCFVILVSFIYSYDIRDTYDLPVFDETLYVQGRYNVFTDWGPLYQYCYYILNKITNSRIDSFYIMLPLLSFILVPLAIYFLSLRFIKEKSTSCILAIWSMLAQWNFPSDPKIQIFNFCLISLGFLARVSNSKFSFIGKCFSYFIFSMSIFCRTDNIVILITVLCFDLYWYLKEKKIKESILAFAVPTITYISFLFIFGSPFSPTRTWYAFIDHFSWKNPEYFREQINNGVGIYNALNVFFDGASSIPEAFINRPIEVTLHFFKNLLTLPNSLLNNFKFLYLGQYSLLFFLLLIFILLSNDNSKIKHQEKKNSFEFYLFITAITLKVFVTAILLQALPKYIFELNIIILFSIAYFAPTIKESLILKTRNIATLVFIFLLIISPFLLKHPVYKHRFPINLTLEKTQQIIKDRPVNLILCNDAFLTWTNSSIPMINLWADHRHDELIKNDLKLFLNKMKVDLIIIEDIHRHLTELQGFKHQWLNFENNWEDYGYDLYFRDQNNTISIYVARQKDPVTSTE